MWHEFNDIDLLLSNPNILYENSRINDLIYNMLFGYNFSYINTIKVLKKINGFVVKSYEDRFIIYSADKKKGYVMMYDNPTELYDNKTPNIRVYDRVLQDLSTVDFETLFNWLDDDNNINMLDNVLRNLEKENSINHEDNLKWLDSILTLLNAKSNYVKNKRNAERQSRINTINNQIEDLVNERACLKDGMEE